MQKLFTILFSVFMISAFAQSNDYTFQVGSIDNEFVSASASTKDGNLIFGGGFSKKASWKGNPIFSRPYEEDIFIIKTDKNGKPIWHKTFGGESTEDIEAIVIDKNNNIYLSVSFEDDFYIDTFFIKSVTYHNSLLVKLNPLGDVIWTKVFESDYDNYPTNLAVNELGDVFISGIANGQYIKIEKDSLFIKPNTNGNSSFLFKFNSNGQLGFSRILYSVNDGLVTCKPLAVKNGEIYISGRISSYSDIYFNQSKINSNFSGIYILKLDYNGDIIRSDFYRTEKFETSTEYIHINNDSSIYFALTYADTLIFQNTNLGTVGKFRHPDNAVFKLDKNGKEIWHHAFGSLKQDDISAAAVDKFENLYIASDYAGSITLAGKEYDPSGQSDILLLKYDKNGNISNIKYSETENPGGGGVGSGASGIVPMENGDVYVSGYFVGKTKFSNTTLTNVYFIDGFVWRISNLATGIAENAVAKNIKLDIYPNPTDGEIYVRSKENKGQSIFTVTDICGRLVYSQNVNNYSEIQALDLSHLPKGSYIIRKQNVNSISTAKVILQ